MCESFLCNAISNFVSDFFAGVIIGSIFAWLIGKRISKFEQAQQRKDEKISSFVKTIQYLELLKKEVEVQLEKLPNLIQTFETQKEITQDIELEIFTSFWEAIKPSGELPKLLHPQLLASITEYYDRLGFVKRVMGRFFPNSSSNIYGWGTFNRSSLQGLRDAQRLGEKLPEKIDEELQKLKIDHEALITTK